jgi:hypothetical protein
MPPPPLPASTPVAAPAALPSDDIDALPPSDCIDTLDAELKWSLPAASTPPGHARAGRTCTPAAVGAAQHVASSRPPPPPLLLLLLLLLLVLLATC